MSATAGNPGYFLGIDGGGTKTRAVVVDARGEECGVAVTGGANTHRDGLERAAAHVISAAEQAAARAGARLPLAAAWLGLAGLDGPSDAERLLSKLAPIAAVNHLTNDSELLLGALPGQTGVALIAGTGAIATGRSPTGQTTRVSGWGHTFGDEGSGYDLGRSALIAAARYADGRGAPTRLLEDILAAWGLDVADDLIGQVYYGHDGVSESVRVARLAPLVLQAARDGDRVARRIVRRGALELARAAIATAKQLDFGAAPLPLALGGSLLLRAEDYRDLILGAISRQRPVGAVVLVERPALSAARACMTLHAADAISPASPGGRLLRQE